MRVKTKFTCAVAVVAATATLSVGAPSEAGASAPSCSEGWQSETMASGLGWLENLEPDGRGGFYVSGGDNGELYHVDSANNVETVLSGLDKPAGLRLAGTDLYFVTGDDPMRTVADGTLKRLDTNSGSVTTLADGLYGPNGLLLLPDGDLLISRIDIFGPPTGIARYTPSTNTLDRSWSTIPRSNGMALTPDGTAFYTGDVTSQILRVPLDSPSTPSTVMGFPDLIGLPDDMEAVADGTLYVADHLAGAVYRINPETREACTVLTGMIKPPAPIRMPPDGPTSVRVAPDGDGWALYVTGFDGTLRKLRPPPGVDLAPA
ncbi:SMP-30/gluconolactonase/LRE family protein [Rhodococcus sp. NPDC058521]|uniref:SMP-30/gluconolactonase/LRE family protein n=1 Tax=Rhodococcus sp. NPDC058521 TaxID=3346536 RepID=UPI003664FAC9